MPRKAAATAEIDGDELSDEAMDRIGYMASSARMSAGTLTGDLRDALLDIIKSRPKPWSAMNEAEQMKTVTAIEDAARTLVKATVEVICSDGIVEPVKAILEGYTDKGDIKGTIKVKTMNDEDGELAISTLHKMRGKMVLISIASHDDYLGERAPATTEPDQNDLEFESADVEDARRRRLILPPQRAGDAPARR